MTTYTVSNEEFTVTYASASYSGYGHRNITVRVLVRGREVAFSETTNFMRRFWEADDLEGQEKYEALYELVSDSINEQLAEWLYWNE